jgi:alpha-amylase/alpha-mannosidase (GH57 family)
MPPRIAIHGHFYQPPRENPWTQRVERQPSAAPDHDWNIRIARECYIPNLDRGNLSFLSFNFGPTLLAWADGALPELSSGVVASDRAALARDPKGPAMAQLYSHPIAPLLGERDLRTQVRWGILDFTKRFGRAPEGMWLPECGADHRSLRILAEEGIRFTVLAPTQARRFRDGDGPWQTVGEHGIDSSQPARVDLEGGKSLIIFFFDRTASQSISFGDALASPERLVDLLKRAALARGADGLLFVATDGETFGHHKKGGDASLQMALETLRNDPDVALTHIGCVAAEGLPQRIVEIHEPSAWSCAHGVGRWERDCGCNLGGGQQRWRAPLREGIAQLTERIHGIFERDGGAVFRDPWEARDLCGGADPSSIARAPWFAESLRRPEQESDRRRALRLLEMERQLLFAHTSCGWFFDDISGIETIQNLRCAARAIELSRAGAPMEDELLSVLRRAPSNDAHIGDGASVYRRFVLTSEVDKWAIAGRAALKWLFLQNSPELEIAGFRASAVDFASAAVRRRTLATGLATVEDAFDGPAEWIAFASMAIGDGECFVYLGSGNDRERAAHAASEVRSAFLQARLPECLKVMAYHYTTKMIHSLDLGFDEAEELARAERGERESR